MDERMPVGNEGSSRPGSAKKAQYSDRFIPSRRGISLQDSFALLPDSQPKKRDAPQEGGKDDNLDTYNMLLRSEFLGSEPHGARRMDELSPASPQRNLFRYRALPNSRADENAAYALSPVGSDSQRVLCSPRKAPRKISTVPYKVLDAPALQVSPHPRQPRQPGVPNPRSLPRPGTVASACTHERIPTYPACAPTRPPRSCAPSRAQDDFYLNLVDWSSLNVLAVGLGTCVYLWSACTSKVTKLCDLGPEDSVRARPIASAWHMRFVAASGPGRGRGERGRREAARQSGLVLAPARRRLQRVLAARVAAARCARTGGAPP